MTGAKIAAQWTIVFTLRVLFVLLGLIIVPLALPFRKDSKSVSDGRDISNLPRWAYPWGNDSDGVLGDKRDWWKENTPFNLTTTNFFSMFVWTAIRNPANNLRMYSYFQAPITGSTITYTGDYSVEDDVGGSGMQLVKASNGGKSWWGFYLVHQYKFHPTHAFVVRLGFKIKPSHAGMVDSPKGFVSKISLWKTL